MKSITEQLDERLNVYRNLEEPSIKDEAWLSLKRFAIRHGIEISEYTRKDIDTNTLSDYELRNLFY